MTTIWAQFVTGAGLPIHHNMKILTKEQKDKLKYVAPVGYRRSDFTDMALSLKDGQSIFISKEEWKVKGYRYTPRKLLTAYYYNPNSRLFKMKFKVQTTHEGWVVSKE